jgi:cytochrome oxidase Cu insertion factor (SCO1/SenC/PrrC family)
MAGVATTTAGVPETDGGLDAPEEAAGAPPARAPAEHHTGEGPKRPPNAPGPPTYTIGTSQFPRRAVNAVVAAVLGLVVLTVVINRVAQSAPGTESTTPTTVVHPAVGGIAAPPAAAQLHAPLRELLGLTTLKGRRAAGFSLTNAATGSHVTLASLRGRVVVLTFANADCKDICPVLAAELHAAAAGLARSSVPVAFVTVNSDPLSTSPGDAAIVHQPLLASLPGWMFLTGSVHSLNTVWKDYGISITADRTTGVVTHNELLYFITAKGTLAWSALPFADESDSGTYTLPAAEIDRFGSGIAHYAAELAK